MKRLITLMLGLCMAAGVAVSSMVLREPSQGFLARHWEDQLNSASEAEARILLHEADLLGPRGIPVLVEALGSSREVVARTGKRLLQEKLDQWEWLDPRLASPRLEVMARALEDRVERFGPTARADAAELATRLLRWPLDKEVVQRHRVIAACEKILRTTGCPSRKGAMACQSESCTAPVLSENSAREPRSKYQPCMDEPASGVRVTVLADLPGGGLPVEGVPQKARHTEPSVEAEVADSRSNEPQKLQVPQEMRALGAAAARKSFAVEPGKTRKPLGHSTASIEDTAPIENTESATVRSWQQAAVRDVSPSNPSKALSEVETVSLIRQLCAGGSSSSAAAHRELTRRGFTEVHFELAHRLCDPSPEVRRRLAGALPGMRGIDPEPWLLWLCRDDDAEVRYAALSLLITSGDPALLTEVESLARRDSDPRIRRQAEAIQRLRDGIRY